MEIDNTNVTPNATTETLLQNLYSGLNHVMARLEELKESFDTKLDHCTRDITEIQRTLMTVTEHGERTMEKLDACTQEMSDMRESFDVKLEALLLELDSTILSNQDKRHIMTWLETVGKTSMPKLLYRASTDGWEGTDFHAKCDNRGATLTVIKSSKGYMFGGYLESSWNSNDERISSSKSFVFSLQCHSGLVPTKFDVRNTQRNYSAYGRASCGPVFGWSDIVICNNANENSDSYFNGNNYTYPYDVNPQTFRTGDEKFKVSEVEVFRVI